MDSNIVKRQGASNATKPPNRAPGPRDLDLDAEIIHVLK